MRSHDIDFDVTEATGFDEPIAVAATLHLPDTLAAGTPVDLLFCLHGGGYRRRYWHPSVGENDTFSLARFFTDRGKAVIAIDQLGMGDSSRPEPESRLNRMMIATAADSVLRQALAGLADGRWASASAISVTGVGHSIGGMMIITQAAAFGGFDRVAVLGWANEPMILGDTDPATLAAGIPASGYLHTPAEPMRALFYLPDVPMDVVLADEADRSPTPSCLGRDALTPGIVHAAAASITAPIFVLHSVVDTSPAPHKETTYFTGSHDVTLSVLEGAAHCQNFATTRREHWDRLDRWIESVP